MGTRYDLEDRLIRFGAAVCRLASQLPGTALGKHVAHQLIRCSTSPLANYGEVQAAESRRDFIHKLQLCLKELRETRAWLLFIAQMRLLADEALRGSLQESQELIAIMRASIRTAKANANDECRMSNDE